MDTILKEQKQKMNKEQSRSPVDALLFCPLIKNCMHNGAWGCVEILPGSVNPLHPNIGIHILQTVLYTFIDSKENYRSDLGSERVKLVIISFILMTFTFDSRVIL